MKKLLTLLLISTAVCSLLVGCGNDDNTSANSGVIISAGDSASNNSTSENDSTSEINSETSELDSEEASSETSENVVVEGEALYGNWVDVSGNVLQFTVDGFTGLFTDNPEAVYGTFDTDWNTYMNITYTILTLNEEIADITEDTQNTEDAPEDITDDTHSVDANANMYLTEDVEMNLDIISIDSTNNKITVKNGSTTVEYTYYPIEGDESTNESTESNSETAIPDFIEEDFVEENVDTTVE